VDEAMKHVLGFTCANDVSQRDIQNGDRSGWFRGKSFDTFLPIGPRIVPREEITDVQNLTVQTRLNGAVVQEGNTGQMIFPVAETIAFISRNFTLAAGDIILTGTPAGIGPIRHGDTVEVEIESIGTLTNPVTDSRR
jgi:2-keto-4-pentenoate hydratase/2-oxohepta-3-ene-1,7-dioic acid hydratase in catechol pathway